MDSLHDLGGKQGFGQVVYPWPLHDETWEPTVHALSRLRVTQPHLQHGRNAPRHRTYGAAALYVGGVFRAAPDRHCYVAGGKGLTTREELEALAGGRFRLSGPIGLGRPPAEPQIFEIGKTIRVKNEHAPGHVRMPGYIRGKTGVVIGITPAYPFPDAAGHGMQAPMEPTYDVRFRSRDLWPDACDDALNHVGVFQSYLERAES